MSLVSAPPNSRVGALVYAIECSHAGTTDGSITEGDWEDAYAAAVLPARKGNVVEQLFGVPTQEEGTTG